MRGFCFEENDESVNNILCALLLLKITGFNDSSYPQEELLFSARRVYLKYKILREGLHHSRHLKGCLTLLDYCL